jgi:hypothetical protein
MAKESNLINIITSFKDKYTKRITELEEENTKLNNLLLKHNDLKKAYSESEAEIIKLNEQIVKLNKDHKDKIEEITNLLSTTIIDEKPSRCVVDVNSPVLTSMPINDHYISPEQLEKRLDQLHKKPARRFKKCYYRRVLKSKFDKDDFDVDLYNDNFKKLMTNYNINNVMKIVSDKDDEQIDNSYSYFSGPLPEKVETKLPFQEPFSLFSFPNPFLDLSYKKKD